MSGTNLLYPVMAALVILMPLKPRTIAGGLLLVALFGIGGSVSIDVTDARKPEGQTRQLLLFVFRTAAGIECSGRGVLALLAGTVIGHLYAACFRVCDACNRRTTYGSAAQARHGCRSTASGTQRRRARDGSVRHPHGLAAVLRQHPPPDPGSETRRF
jgi:hypothetical protein